MKPVTSLVAVVVALTAACTGAATDAYVAQHPEQAEGVAIGIASAQCIEQLAAGVILHDSWQQVSIGVLACVAGVLGQVTVDKLTDDSKALVQKDYESKAMKARVKAFNESLQLTPESVAAPK